MTTPSQSVISIDERCQAIAAASRRRPAVIGFGKRGEEDALTWLELERESAARVGLLDRLGRDAVVAFEAPNRVETVILLLACLRAGVPFIPLEPKVPPGERARLLQAVGTRHRVTTWDGRTPPSLSEALPPEAQPLGAQPSGQPAGCVAETAPVKVGYFLASGSSSGRPRLIPHPGPPGYDSARIPNALLSATGWLSGQRQLIVGPLHHAAPFTTCVEALLDGNCVLLQETFNPRATVRILDDHAVEWLELTPTHMQWLLMAMEREEPALRSLRALVHTAARCPDAVKRGWIDRLGPARVFEFYAATEGIGTTLVRGDEWLRRPGTVGRGFCTQIRILDERDRDLPAGSVGQVYMRRSGFAVRPAGPGASVRRAAGGFSSVGDYGWLDQERYLFLSPRREDLVIVGGTNVYPAEVENVLVEHPEILDSAVTGVADGLIGTKLVAFVVPRPGAMLDEPAVLAFCSERLSQHKVPSSVRLVDQVPRSEAGKLQRWKLRETAGVAEDGGRLWMTPAPGQAARFSPPSGPH
jgi:bile acid-coenzyme A ligase